MTMKLTLTILTTIMLTVATYGQTNNVQTLIDEGVALHDQGQYQQAIDKYKEALKLDSNSVTAIYEMAFSYFSLKDYDETEGLCRKL